MFNAKYPILIHNVDILSNVDLSAFYSLDEKVMCPDCGCLTCWQVPTCS
jgi:hypothetical protein